MHEINVEIFFNYFFVFIGIKSMIVYSGVGDLLFGY